MIHSINQTHAAHCHWFVVNESWIEIIRSIYIDFYLLCLLKPLILHISAGLIGPREIRVTRMKRITWFRGHILRQTFQTQWDLCIHSPLPCNTIFLFQHGSYTFHISLDVDYRTHFLPATGTLNLTIFVACDFSSATAISLRMWFKMNLFWPWVPIFWMKSWSSHHLCLTQLP